MSHIAVIGSGIIGVTCAIELNRLGHAVTVFDREPPGSRAAASFGNGGWLCPASIIPVATPDLWRTLPSFVFGASAPLGGRIGYALRHAGHFLRFLASGGSQAKVRHKAAALAQLLANSADLHLALAREAGLSHLIRKDGLLYTYRTRDALNRDRAWWQLRRDLGVSWSFLDGAALRGQEPEIAPDCHGAILVEQGGHCTDPAAYVAGLAAFARSRGVRFEIAAVERLGFDGQRLTHIETSAGRFGCDGAVVCCGAFSRPLALQSGARPSLLAERGYHVTVEQAPRLNRPVMFDDALMVATPMAAGMRFAGQVEIAAPDSPPDWRRAEALLRLAGRYLPGLPVSLDAPGVSKWMGNRPAMADELPVIGRSPARENVYYAFGHGYTGLGGAPATARLLGQALQANAPADAALSPFSPGRL